MASASSVAAMASATRALTSARLEMADSAPGAGPAAMISSRSSSASTGENCSTGAATAISASRASRRMTSGGASTTSLRASDTISRTLTIWSRARISRVS